MKTITEISYEELAEQVSGSSVYRCNYCNNIRTDESTSTSCTGDCEESLFEDFNMSYSSELNFHEK